MLSIAGIAGTIVGIVAAAAIWAVIIKFCFESNKE